MNWLLLRGLTREQRHWGTFPQELEAQLSGHKAFCLDLAGTGTELLRDSPWSIRGIQEDVRNRWLPLKEKHPGDWFLFGISLGGMVSMDWVAEHAEDFKGVVLLNTSAANLSLPQTRLKSENFGPLLQVAMTRESFARERSILKLTTALVPDLDGMAAEFAALASDSAQVSKAFVRQLLAAIRYRAPERLPIPSLFLTAAQDRFTDPSCSFKLARRFHSPLKMHATAGHDVTLDDPKWVAQEIHAWLGKKFQV